MDGDKRGVSLISVDFQGLFFQESYQDIDFADWWNRK
jgi:hypothetical protein